MFNLYECIKHKTPHEYLVQDLAEVAEVIRERESPLIVDIRSIDRMKKKQQYYDHKINYHPCLSVHGIFQNYCSKKYFLKPTGYLYYDFDGLIEEIESFKEKIIQEYGQIISLLTISTGGKGIGFFVKLKNPELITADNFTLIHKQVKNRYFPNLKIKMDSYAGGITRQWIIPHDKNVYFNENPSLVSFDIKEKNIGDVQAICIINKDQIQNIASGFTFRKHGISFNNTKPIKDFYDTINFQTVVEVEHPVVDIKPVDFCKMGWPRIIEDGKKHSVFFANANILKKVNPTMCFDEFASVMSYINTKFTGNQPMLPETLYGIAKYVYESPNTLVETWVKYIHFNKNCGLTGKEKSLLSQKINAKLKNIRSLMLIDKGIKGVEHDLGKYKLTAARIFKFLQAHNFKICVKTIRKYFEKVKESGVELLAQNIIDDLMNESEYLKHQRKLIFEGIRSDDLLTYNFENESESTIVEEMSIQPEQTEQPLQSPTSTNNDITMKYINPEIEPCEEQINHKQHKEYSDEELGIKSLQQMKREKHFLESYDTVVMNYWHMRRDAIERLKTG